ncbi:MAG: sodium:alanine symporter family protein, partial [Gammaproteobacteria bacterium]|nr:sodium:alanine symporter family protein [Gammaproteobacteria bacterium]
VSILEPFIDTIVICTITGLVILSSGVWAEKLENEFQRADLSFVSGVYVEGNEAHQREIFAYLNNGDSSVASFDGSLQLIDGRLQNEADLTVINSRSFAENVLFSRDGEPITGELAVSDGRLDDLSVVVTGESLVHSVPLTTEAFTRGLFGNYGQYIVSIGLMLFAFSTAIAWSYYGDRAMTYLLGPKSVMPYRVVYVCGFFYAALADTTIIWNVSLITIVLMTAPNLFGILLMRKEMKSTVKEYWEKTDHGRHKA